MSYMLVGILIYVGLQLLVGVWVSRFIKTEIDYLLAGRKLGYWLGTFTIFATWFGAESVIGSSGAIYDGGLAGGSADPFGFGLCLIGMGLVFAVPLWKRKLTTLADLFRQRYSPGIERLAVLMMVPGTLMWASAQILAFGQVLTASSELELEIAITIAAAIVIAYTVLGGLLAVAWTDLIQGVVLIFGLVALLVLLILNVPDLSAVWSQVDPQRLSLRQPDGTSWLDRIDIWAIPLCGSVVAHELVARVIATRSPEVARRACVTAGSMYLGFGMIPAFIGIIGLHLMPGLEDSEQIVPLIAQEYMPTLLYIIFAGALVSAILSTVDSTLLVASSLVSHNLIVNQNPGMAEKQKIGWARIMVVAFGITAWFVATNAEGVYDLVVDAAAFGTAGLFTIVVFGLFSKKGGPLAAGLTLVTAMAVWLSATYIVELSWAFLLSLICALTAFGTGVLAEKQFGLTQPDQASSQ
ncbi:MAG: sodium:solute symporter family protein [Candidatus Cyclonatronum sp.]|uniref:sodium:solute symporter family protein n=1 Tax=Cyclonatronum sp. TaxID=3024185 RepID=UPI0025C33A83|nr:sodium:solute symporter family protein [Cyclonatronum sp.]MCH8486721.1 sodium:solute symporter family protein [Cyclonatronum sp.]